MHPRPLVVTAIGVVLASSIALTISPDGSNSDGRIALPGSTTSWAIDPLTAGTTADGEPAVSLIADRSSALHDIATFTLLLDQGKEADLTAIRTWLTDNDLVAAQMHSTVDAILVTGTLEAIETAFDTRFADFDAFGSRTVAPDRALSVPKRLNSVVGVTGLVRSESIKPSIATAADPIPSPDPAGSTQAPPNVEAPDPSGCATYWGERVSEQWPTSVVVKHRSNTLCGYGPKQLRQIHHVPGKITGAGATIAIVAAFDDPDVEANTNSYFTKYGAAPLAAGQYIHHAPTAPNNDVCGGPSDWTEEQHLDVQAAHAMAPDATIEYWGASDCYSTSLTMRILDVVESGHADVISLSYGSPEATTSADDRALLTRVLVEASARHISVFAASGNDGDYSDFGDHPGEIDVTSPASNPYVTAVGGTSTGLNQNGSIAVEAGWETETRFARNGAIIPPGFAYGAGGGTSRVYDRPSWQRRALPTRSGSKRLLPDVASIADPNTGFTVHGPVAGKTVYARHGGTSLATPMVASMVAMAKAASGLEIGVATPYLYALQGTEALRDITPTSAGVWSATGTDPQALWPETLYLWDTAPQSLQSAKGWDPVTGLGVPNGSAFFTMFGKKK